ncbi:MAG: transcriptional repressor [Ktedonobacterales bacterium]|nr:transcriptional repressor [Ktedonobacterales bacterium]
MLELLNQAGRRVTGPRRRVLDALGTAPTPLTARALAALAGTSVASTYRALGLLVELGMVSEVPEVAAEPEEADGRARCYALCSATGHHHHFVCRSCRATLEITCEALERALADLERGTGLTVEHHELLLRGLCPNCHTKHGAP